MIGIVVIVVAVAYLAWTARRSARRGELGLCVRCGRNARTMVGETGHAGVGEMCAGCAATTERNHRAGFWFFMALPVIGVFAVAVGLISDLRAGFGFSWTYVPMILAVAVLPLAIAAFIRASSNR